MKLLTIAVLLFLIAGASIFYIYVLQRMNNKSIPQNPISTTDSNVISNPDFVGLKIVKSYSPPITKSDDEWKKTLSDDQYYILRQQGTEIPFTGSLVHNEQAGTYVTADCDEPVFRSEDKYDSGTGWPSFSKTIDPDSVVLIEDDTLGIQRIEVVSKKCGGHLGHVFNDGPKPTGLRYCMNSAALKFIPDRDKLNAQWTRY